MPTKHSSPEKVRKDGEPQSQSPYTAAHPEGDHRLAHRTKTVATEEQEKLAITLAGSLILFRNQPLLKAAAYNSEKGEVTTWLNYLHRSVQFSLIRALKNLHTEMETVLRGDQKKAFKTNLLANNLDSSINFLKTTPELATFLQQSRIREVLQKLQTSFQNFKRAQRRARRNSSTGQQRKLRSAASPVNHKQQAARTSSKGKEKGNGKTRHSTPAAFKRSPTTRPFRPGAGEPHPATQRASASHGARRALFSETSTTAVGTGSGCGYGPGALEQASEQAASALRQATRSSTAAFLTQQRRKRTRDERQAEEATPKDTASVTSSVGSLSRSNAIFHYSTTHQTRGMDKLSAGRLAKLLKHLGYEESQLQVHYSIVNNAATSYKNLLRHRNPLCIAEIKNPHGSIQPCVLIKLNAPVRSTEGRATEEDSNRVNRLRALLLQYLPETIKVATKHLLPAELCPAGSRYYLLQLNCNPISQAAFDAALDNIAENDAELDDSVSVADTVEATKQLEPARKTRMMPSSRR